jgi:LmbE family N-acetylglucosaminyl deacetylase
LLGLYPHVVTTMPDVSNFASHVVLSPHPDDAVLSLGACMSAWHRMGHAVTVVTLFDGPPTGALTPAAIEDRTRYREDPVVLRQMEDRRAVTTLGAQLHSIGLEELVYRQRPDGSPRCQSLEDIFGPLDADDDAVVDAVAEILGDLPYDGDVYVPLAIGGHSDHRIVRAAAERVFSRVFFYEDLPYAIRESTTDPSVHWPPLTAADIDAWISAIKIYDSQIGNLFEGLPWEPDFRQFAKLKTER